MIISSIPNWESALSVMHRLRQADEDEAQNALINIACKGYKPSTAVFKAFHPNRQWRTVPLAWEPADYATPEDILLDKERQQEIERKAFAALKAIERLPAKSRAIMRMVAAGYNSRQIADLMDLRHATVRTIIFRARRELASMAR